MDQYKQKLYKRIRYIVVGGMISLVLFILVITGVITPTSMNEQYDSFVAGFQGGLSGAICFACFAFAFHYYRITRDDTKLRNESIKESDERLAFIKLKSGSAQLIWAAYIFIIVGVVSAYFNGYVFATLIISSYLLLIMKIVLYTYYARKY